MKKVIKVWGWEEWIVNNDLYCGKFLYLKKGFQCSLHYHPKKHETFFIEHGKVIMECKNDTTIMGAGKTITILPKTRHRFTGLEDSVIIEISTPHSDGDVVRIEESREVKHGI